MTGKPQVKHVIGIVEIGEKNKQNWKSFEMKAKGRAVPDGKKEKREDKHFVIHIQKNSAVVNF